MFKDRGAPRVNPGSADDDVTSSIHLPFNLSRESIEKRSKEICQNLVKMFEKIDKKLEKFDSDLSGGEASNPNLGESEAEAKLNNQLDLAKKEIEMLERLEKEILLSGNMEYFFFVSFSFFYTRTMCK